MDTIGGNRGGISMDFDVEQLDQSRVKLSIEVDGKRLEEGLNYAYRKVVKKVVIPGFRKGKAPRMILERHYGQEVLYEDALDYLLPKLYEEAVEQAEIKPIAQPDIQLQKIEPKEGLSFEVEVDVYPEIELGEYKGLAVEKHIKTISDQDIDSEIEQLRHRHSELIAVDYRDDLKEKDFANIDFKGYIDGKPFSGGAKEGHTLEIGSGQFIPGFEEQLIGMQVNEEKDIEVTFPADYNSDELAGKTATFTVKLNSIKERLLPDLDDEFAKDVSEFETLAELKDDIRSKLETNATDGTKRDLENRLIEQIIENSNIDIPKSMVDNQIEYMLDNLRTNLAYSGMDFETYLKYTKKSEEEFKDEMRPEAVKQVKRSLLIEEIADQEGISASEEEINQKIDTFVEESSDPEKTRQTWENRTKDLSSMLKIDKTWDFLIDHAQITEVEDEPEKPETTPEK